MFAEGDGATVAIGRDVSYGDEWHADPLGESFMIRADSTLAYARDGSVFPQGTGQCRDLHDPQCPLHVDSVEKLEN
jgi:hypothetical protein